jgi:hypothetical protein
MLGVGVGQVQGGERMVQCQVHCSTCVRLCLSSAGTSCSSVQIGHMCMLCDVMVRTAGCCSSFNAAVSLFFCLGVLKCEDATAEQKEHSSSY